MTKLVPNYGGKLDLAPLEVKEESVQRYLDKGWALAEGETFTAPAPKKVGRTLEVNQNLVPRDYKPGENDGEATGVPSTGVDTGKPLGANQVIDTPVLIDGRKVIQTNATGAVKVGLSGKSKEILLGIAAAEGIAVDPELSKPAIKAAIEEARGETPSGDNEDATDSDTNDDGNDGATPADDSTDD